MSKGMADMVQSSRQHKELGLTLLESFEPPIVTVADLLDRLDGISAERVRFFPIPGTATVEDVIEIEARENRLCELVDGVLVEKPMGMRESILAVRLILRLGAFVEAMKLGFVAGEGGMMQLRRALVRIPDVAFMSWASLPGGRLPPDAAPLLAPDLAVEILSPSNTRREMARKLREYFEAGAKLVWYIDPDPRTVAVYVEPENPTVLTEQDVLDGGTVVPGFTLALRDLFAVLDQLPGDEPAMPPTA
jgi:Uma2 family endonuclease